MSSYPNLNQTDFLRTNITDQIPSMLAYWDRDLVLRYANVAFSNRFGKVGHELVGYAALPDILGDVYESIYPYIQKVMIGEQQVFESEIPDTFGMRHYSKIHFSPDVDYGAVLGFYSFISDISDSKHLENELKDSNRKITEQNERLKNFANIVSHNLRSYSNNLQSVVHILQETKDEDTKAQLVGFLMDISKSFSSTIQNLNDIVDIYNNTQVQLDHLNLTENIEKVCMVLGPEIESTGATILNRVNRDVFLMANPAYLESILLNVISNSIKYRHDDRAPLIEIQCNEDDMYIRLQISDNGQGINLIRHGNDLFKMNKTFHRNPDAKGIGLFITKQQVETMDGRIEASSDGEHGTTFIICFRK